MKKIKNKVILIWIALAFVILLIYIAIIPNTVKNIAINSIECYEDGILLSWNNEDSNNYCIYRKDKNEKWIVIAKCDDNNYYDKDVAIDNTYSYAIQCIDKNNNKLSKKIMGEKEVYYCSMPEIISYNVDEAIIINWSQVDGAEGYEILRKSEEAEWEVIALVAADRLEYVDSDIETNSEYKYSVRIVGSEYANRFYHEGTTIKKYEAPSEIKLRCVVDGINVRWNKISDIKNYCVMRKSSVDNEWVEVAIVNGKAKYVDSDVKVGEEYTYAIRCLGNQGGNYVSDYVAEGKTIFICESPVLENIVIDNESIRISWKDVEGAEKYRIYLKVDTEEKYNALETIKSDNSYYVYSDISQGHKYTFTVRCLSEDETMFVSMYDSEGISIEY